MTPRIITADEAKALLNGTSPGPWYDAGYRDRRLDGPHIRDDAEDCVAVVTIDNPQRDNDRHLLAAAPDLAATIVAQAAEIDALKSQRDAQAVGLRVVALWLGGPHHAEDPESVSSLARTKGREIDNLRAIIDGRTTPPTDAEIRDVARAGLTVILHAIDARTGRIVDLRTRDVQLISVWATHHADGHFASAVWRLIDANDRPIAWPVPSEPR